MFCHSRHCYFRCYGCCCCCCYSSCCYDCCGHYSHPAIATATLLLLLLQLHCYCCSCYSFCYCCSCYSFCCCCCCSYRLWQPGPAQGPSPIARLALLRVVFFIAWQGRLVAARELGSSKSNNAAVAAAARHVQRQRRQWLAKQEL